MEVLKDELRTEKHKTEDARIVEAQIFQRILNFSQHCTSMICTDLGIRLDDIRHNGPAAWVAGEGEDGTGAGSEVSPGGSCQDQQMAQVHPQYVLAAPHHSLPPTPLTIVTWWRKVLIIAGMSRNGVTYITL